MNTYILVIITLVSYWGRPGFDSLPGGRFPWCSSQFSSLPSRDSGTVFFNNNNSWIYLYCILLHVYARYVLFGTTVPFDLYTVEGNSCNWVCIYRYCHIYCFLIVFIIMLLYGVGTSKGYFSVGAFQYFGNMFCFLSEVCECDSFVSFVGVFFGVMFVRYDNILFKCLFCGSVYLALALL
jgi:hypothetical protein